jgi:hypothetical protein
MRVYDIALAVVRLLVAMDFVRAAASVVYTGIRFAYLIPSTGDSLWLNKVELSSWLSPIYAFITAAMLLAASRPIARFAAKLATPNDAASHF